VQLELREPRAQGKEFVGPEPPLNWDNATVTMATPNLTDVSAPLFLTFAVLSAPRDLAWKLGPRGALLVFTQALSSGA
jgi:hypothetical protein